ncbi:MAG: NrpR regulatory domain-containing protein [Candidatus Nezhaarchaeota archaeon]|nr:NrpR regulatory domain-containing protein [Candidatus Nezhaarchaeota archaeon]
MSVDYKNDILRYLYFNGGRVSSLKLEKELEERGIKLSASAIRYHLRTLESLGYVTTTRRGSMITERGIEEIWRSNVHKRIGFFRDFMAEIIYNTKFDIECGEGVVSVNTTMVHRSRLDECLEFMRKLKGTCLCIYPKIKIAYEGERVGNVVIPKEGACIITLCSLIFDAALFHFGIPLTQILAGYVELEEWCMTRFTDVIMFEGTSLDPIITLLSLKQTSIAKTPITGRGVVIGELIKVPESSFKDLKLVFSKLEKLNIRCLKTFGSAGKPILGINVGENVGVVFSVGINMVAPILERNIPCKIRGATTMMDIGDLDEEL